MWRNGGQTRTTTPAHRQWRAAVLRRDGYRCQLRYAGCLGRATIADHVVNVKAGGLELDVANGQGACVNCHKVKTAREAREGRRAMLAKLRLPASRHPGLG